VISGSRTLVLVYVVCDVNSGTEVLQVDCGNDCKENQKQKNRERKTLSFNPSLPVSAFIMCFILSSPGSLPP